MPFDIVDKVCYLVNEGNGGYYITDMLTLTKLLPMGQTPSLESVPERAESEVKAQTVSDRTVPPREAQTVPERAMSALPSVSPVGPSDGEKNYWAALEATERKRMSILDTLIEVRAQAQAQAQAQTVPERAQAVPERAQTVPPREAVPEVKP